MAGEAKRRKMAGEYPDANDPLTAAKRSWCGRGPVPVEDFRVPEGLLAITFDVAGAAPSTCMISVAGLVEAMERATEIMRLPYYQIVRGTAHGALQARKQGDDAALQGIGLMGIWTVFNHPRSGVAMRRGVSRQLRETGRSHITWRYGPSGLAMAIAGSFIDLEPAMDAAPKDSQFLFEEAPDGEEAMQ